MTLRTSTSRRNDRALPRHLGFTLIEMLAVLALMAILLGIGAGSWSRAVPANQLATFQLRDAVRRARHFAVKEGAPAFVMVEAPNDEEHGAELTAGGQRTVGQWHFEEESLAGYPNAPIATGADLVKNGVIGHGLKLSGTKPAFLDLGRSSSFDAVDGVFLEMFVKPDMPRARVLFEKGPSYSLSLDTDLKLRGHVMLRTEAELERDTGKRLDIEAGGAPLPVGCYSRVSMAFDGQAISISIDGLVRSHYRLPARARMLPAPAAALMIGKVGEPFGGEIDEARVAVLVLERSRELPPAVKFGAKHFDIRFDPGGMLDPLYHQAPVEIPFESGKPPKARKVVVDLMGEMR
jgi:prepilin-type N-terminal cleavage/methylation domain-containing protein